MKLRPGERSIFASFGSGPNAEACRDELQQAGFQEVQLDRIGKVGFRPDTFKERPAIAGDETSVTAAVMNPPRTALVDDQRPLLAAFPEASGMSSPDTADRAPFLIVVVTTDDRVDEAVSICEKHGGRV
ncbi:MAG TPA: hypothetical protein VK464_21770 [Symbiobacteriaceae bacterium]|jgi:hypothetical protein|nr:hypothetical protein [Symbiobacteriaceae bacterium]